MEGAGTRERRNDHTVRGSGDALSIPGYGHGPASAAWLLESLTEREGEGLLLLGAGLRNKQLAQELGTADRTVKAHIANFVGGVRSGRRRGPGLRSCRLSRMTRCVTTRRARDTNPRYRAATGGLPPRDGAACARSVPGAGAGPAGPVPLYGRRSQRESVESAPVQAELAPYRPNSLPNESDSPRRGGRTHLRRGDLTPTGCTVRSALSAR